MEADLKSEYKGVKGLNALYRRLYAKHFTAIADMHDVLRTKYLRMRFSVDHYRVVHIDKHRKEKRQLTRQKNKQLRQLPTTFQNYADVLEKLGYPIQLDFTPMTSEATQNASPKIGIAPMAAHVGKIYPLNKMQHVVDLLLEDYPDATVYLFGNAKKEREQLETVANNHSQCKIVGDFAHSLKEEIELMRQLNVMVCMDSANMHLAALTSTPVVSIWGQTHPYAGFIEDHIRDGVVQVELPCRPCSIYGNKQCQFGDYRCMNQIDELHIIKYIKRFL